MQSSIPANPPGFSGFIPKKTSLPADPDIGWWILPDSAALACPRGSTHSDRAARVWHLELMRRKERPTTQYSAERRLHLNDSNTFLIRSDAQVGEFPRAFVRALMRIIRALHIIT